MSMHWFRLDWWLEYANMLALVITWDDNNKGVTFDNTMVLMDSLRLVGLDSDIANVRGV